MFSKEQIEAAKVRLREEGMEWDQMFIACCTPSPDLVFMYYRECGPKFQRDLDEAPFLWLMTFDEALEYEGKLKDKVQELLKSAILP